MCVCVGGGGGGGVEGGGGSAIALPVLLYRQAKNKFHRGPMTKTEHSN